MGDRKLRLSQVEQIPLQYSKPLRRTAYLHEYPFTINGGILYKNHEYNQRTWDLPDPNLMDLFAGNQVSMSADRLKDARAIPWERR